ncbi:Putative ribonuclease H protein At1g65750 [Linum perenne]
MCDFWSDFWVRGVRLDTKFPRIAAAALSLDASISDLVSFSDRLSWNIPLRYQLRGGALLEWYNFLIFISSTRRDLFTAGPAYIYWPIHPGGSFTVSSLRHALVAENFNGCIAFPSKLIWQSVAPTKVACFAWKVFDSKITTVDNLQRKGFSFVNKCVLCNANLESVKHIFLDCAFSTKVWALLSSRLSIFGPFHSSIASFMVGWKELNCTKSFAPVMKVLLHAFLWNIWIERNSRIFKDIVNTPGYTLRRIGIAIGDWLLADGTYSAPDLIRWRRLIFDNG